MLFLLTSQSSGKGIDGLCRGITRHIVSDTLPGLSSFTTSLSYTLQDKLGLAKTPLAILRPPPPVKLPCDTLDFLPSAKRHKALPTVHYNLAEWVQCLQNQTVPTCHHKPCTFSLTATQTLVDSPIPAFIVEDSTCLLNNKFSITYPGPIPRMFYVQSKLQRFGSLLDMEG